MREILFFIASIAGAGVLAALQVILAPNSPFWRWVLWIGVCILVLCAFGLLIDIIRRRVHAKDDDRIGLRCTFAENIPGCVQRDAKASFRASPYNDPIVPPLVTVSPSQGSYFIQTDMPITLYRIKVEVVGERQANNCSGRLRSISRDDRVWGSMNILLTFAPAEKRDETTAKTIHPGTTDQFLDVFYITDDNLIRIHSS
jgi:hypothetical protein